MEYCDRGDLSKLLSDYKIKFKGAMYPEDKIWKFFL